MKLPFGLSALTFKRDQIQPYKRGLLLQWHITHRCGRRCAHCYQESYEGEELPFSALMNILEQYKDLLAAKAPGRGHVTVTGGEPFARGDIWRLLETLSAHEALFGFAILTNGQHIDDSSARRLKKLNPRFVQLSVEGSPEAHDSIRGAGDHARVVKALQVLRGAGLKTMISFTAHSENYREFPQVAELGRKLGVNRVWTDRLIPCGAGASLAMMDPEETMEYLSIVDGERRKADRSIFSRTQVAADRALQFLTAGGKPYKCSAGDSLITIMPDGTLYPCRRLARSVGNVMHTPLKELYHEDRLFCALRDAGRVSRECEGCLYQRFCGGGLKCLSWAKYGDPFRADPGCPMAGGDKRDDKGYIL